MAESELIVYGTDWRGDCRRARRLRDERRILHRWINIERGQASQVLVRKLNRGNRSVPTPVFPDGSMLVEPSTSELAQPFGARPEEGEWTRTCTHFSIAWMRPAS